MPLLPSLLAKLSILPHLFQATRDALFSPSLPFTHRYLLLLIQPLNLLAPLLTSPHWLFTTRPHSVLYIPTRSGSKRCLVWQPPRKPATGSKSKKEKDGGDGKGALRPLHIDIHGGAFMGGYPELDARWCAHLSSSTGAVVVSCSYRFAPRYTFPAAHDDIDDVVSWLADHAAEELGADPRVLTVGGASAGGNLALSAARGLGREKVEQEGMGRGDVAHAALLFLPVLDLRLHPRDKPKPPNFPTSDPTSFLMPLFDAYAGPTRERDWNDARLNSGEVARREELPRDVLIVAAGVDILLAEQVRFVERVGKEDKEGEGSVELRVWEKGFHGWLELPSFILEKERMEAFDAGVTFIKNVHRRLGFDIDKLD